MALFKRKKDDRVLDLTERYRKQLDAETKQSLMENRKLDSQSPQPRQAQGFDFLGNMASASGAQQNAPENVGESANDRKRKLGKRLIEMTNKLEEISNQIYHLQQRVEVLERKAGVRME